MTTSKTNKGFSVGRGIYNAGGGSETDIDTLSKKWIELLFENVLNNDGLGLGNGKNIYNNKYTRKASRP